MYFAIVLSSESDLTFNSNPKEIKNLGKTFREHADSSSNKITAIFYRRPKKRSLLTLLYTCIKKVIKRNTFEPLGPQHDILDLSGTRGYVVWTDTPDLFRSFYKINVIYGKDFPSDKQLMAFSDPPELKETFDYKKIGISEDMIKL